MRSAGVREASTRLTAAGVARAVTGGWGVDALGLTAALPCLAPHVRHGFHTGLRQRPQHGYDLCIFVRAEHRRGIDLYGSLPRGAALTAART